MRNVRKGSKKYSKGSLHGALNKLYPKTGICENCGAESDRTNHYSLIHGREYSLNRDDYRELCAACHGAYDNHQEGAIPCNCENKKGHYLHGWGYAKIPVLMNEKNCEHCGITLYTLRTDAKYCSNLCKSRAAKERKGTNVRAPMKHTSCQRPGCCNLLSPDVKYNTAYCSNACRQAVYNKSTEQQRLEARQRVKAEREKAQAVESFIQELMK